MKTNLDDDDDDDDDDYDIYIYIYILKIWKKDVFMAAAGWLLIDESQH